MQNFIVGFNARARSAPLNGEHFSCRCNGQSREQALVRIDVAQEATPVSVSGVHRGLVGTRDSPSLRERMRRSAVQVRGWSRWRLSCRPRRLRVAPSRTPAKHTNATCKRLSVMARPAPCWGPPADSPGARERPGCAAGCSRAGRRPLGPAARLLVSAAGLRRDAPNAPLPRRSARASGGADQPGRERRSGAPSRTRR